jgi:hypothetical protein
MLGPESLPLASYHVQLRAARQPPLAREAESLRAPVAGDWRHAPVVYFVGS